MRSKKEKERQPQPKARLTRSIGRNEYGCVKIPRAALFPGDVVNSPCGFFTNENICITETDGVRENCEGQSCLRKQAENLINKKKIKWQRLQVNAAWGLELDWTVILQ